MLKRSAFVREAADDAEAEQRLAVSVIRTSSMPAMASFLYTVTLLGEKYRGRDGELTAMP